MGNRLGAFSPKVIVILSPRTKAARGRSTVLWCTPAQGLALGNIASGIPCPKIKSTGTAQGSLAATGRATLNWIISKRMHPQLHSLDTGTLRLSSSLWPYTLEKERALFSFLLTTLHPRLMYCKGET